ncbi:MAG: hypothetical protein MUF48_09920, partial [Pirellulaceae bacterium]|nr:hypothetical protein [Pirellulaceae bacterium]
MDDLCSDSSGYMVCVRNPPGGFFACVPFCKGSYKERYGSLPRLYIIENTPCLMVCFFRRCKTINYRFVVYAAGS